MTEYERGFIDGVKSKVEAELTPTIIKMTEGLSQTIQEAIKTVIGNVKITANEPAADLKYGKWIHDIYTQWKCSECGNFLDFDGLNCGRGSAFYCPNCGADMRGEQK